MTRSLTPLASALVVALLTAASVVVSASGCRILGVDTNLKCFTDDNCRPNEFCGADSLCAPRVAGEGEGEGEGGEGEGGEGEGEGGGGCDFTVDELGDTGDVLGDDICRTAIDTCTLRAAISEGLRRTEGATICLPPGTITLDSAFIVDRAANPIEIVGDASGDSVVDAAAVNRHFNVDGGRLSLLAVTLLNGRKDSRDGGAVNVNSGGVFEATSCTFDGNSISGSGHGGALFATGSGTSAAVRRTLFVNNGISGNGNAEDGSAIAVEGGAALIVEDCEFDSNHTTDDGTVFVDVPAANVTIRRALFVDNTAEGDGAGVRFDFPVSTQTLTLENVQFLRNVSGAADAGGALVATGVPNIECRFCVFSGNGPAVTHVDGVLSLVACVVDETVPLVVASDGGTCVSGGSNVVRAADPCIVAEGDVVADPDVGGLADNGGGIRTLIPGNAAAVHDRAPPEFCPDDDARGFARPSGTACDAGAFDVDGDAP